MNFIIGFIVGFIVGGSLGAIVMAIFAVGKDSSNNKRRD